MKNQKGVISPIIIVIIVLAVLIAGGVLAYPYVQPYIQKVIQKAEVPTDQTTGWKTYNEIDFNFTFKYPETWLIKDDLTANTCCLNITNYIFPKSEIGVSKGEIKIQIQNYNKPANMTLQDFVSSLTNMESNIKATSVEDVNIAGINGIKSNLVGDGTYYLPHSSTEGISITVFNHPESRGIFKEIINQLLATFKFTK